MKNITNNKTGELLLNKKAWAVIIAITVLVHFFNKPKDTVWLDQGIITDCVFVPSAKTSYKRAVVHTNNNGEIQSPFNKCDKGMRVKVKAQREVLTKHNVYILSKI